MKITSLAVVLASVALALASASNPCQAGSVTYDFVEGAGAPNPGKIGATITFFSPPASATSGWITNDASSIEGITILDSGLFLDGFTGAFHPQPDQSIDAFSPNGTQLTDGDFLMTVPSLEFTIETIDSSFIAENFGPNVVTGSWTVSASVPEPASAVQAGIASAIGLALAAFRNLKEARRQRPVGSLDANQ
jgi:hypothetical protein